MVTVEISYVGGQRWKGVAWMWSAVRGDGVDKVSVSNASGSSVLQGHSAYWLYREGEIWVAGQASFAYSETLPPEVLFLPDGTQDTRRIDYVPDLRHGSIKLGWWLPGTTGRPF